MGFVKGHTKLGGRPRGQPNRATADIKVLAHKHGPDAIAELARLAKHARSEMTRVAAIRELLDRGYGKALSPYRARSKLASRLSYSGYWTRTMDSLDQFLIGAPPHWWL